MPDPAFADHFSDAAAGYARFRPRYPDALFDHLAALAPRRERAWDCATGSGQAALPLARRFRRVVATDASAEQIAHARRAPGLDYAVARAERAPLAAGVVDLVTVAQALHWLDPEGFYREARRVLRAGGVLAVWSYGRMALEGDGAQRVVDRFYDRTVRDYWPPERRWVEDGLRSFPFPFPEEEAPALAMTAELSLDAMVGYVGTWSATRRCREATGADPLPALRRELARSWGAPDATRTASWPLALRIGRV